MTNLKIAKHSARRLITDDLLRQGVRPDISAHEEDAPFECDLHNVEAVLAECVRRLEDGSFSSVAESDSWLGPRFHASLRISRRAAADEGLWLHLGLTAGFEYALARFGADTKRSRFTGSRAEHALARLWWMVELFRNGPDYGPAQEALGNQDLINTILKMDIAHHRPTCQAIVRTRRRDDDSAPMTGREANALGKAINCTATTLLLRNAGPDAPSTPDLVEQWIGESESFDIRHYFDTLPEGPGDERVPEGSIDALHHLFVELLAAAPVRGDEVKTNESVEAKV